MFQRKSVDLWVEGSNLNELRPPETRDLGIPQPDSPPTPEPEPPEPELRPLRHVDTGVIPYDDATGLLDFLERELFDEEVRQLLRRGK